MRKYIRFFRKYTCIFAILLSCTNTLADENVITQKLPPCRADIATECDATNPENLCDNKVYENGTCYLCGDDLDKDGACNTINTKVKCNSGYEYGLITDTYTYNCRPCTGGFYCPDGEPIPCPANTYSTSGATECTKCPSAYPNTRGNNGANSITSCYAVIPAGKYIKDNSLLDCLAGYYCEGKTIVYYNEDIKEQGIEKCPAGSYCPAGSAEPTKCPAGYYCPAGSAAQTECDAGYYCPAGSAAQTQCPVGYYCPDSSQKIQCPAGYYCPAGSTAQTQCPKGYYCLAGQDRRACPAGTTSDAGAAAENDCFIMGGENGTKFCTTQYGCFTIPQNIYNNNKSTN